MKTRQYLLLMCAMTVASFLGGSVAVLMLGGRIASAEADVIRTTGVVFVDILGKDAMKLSMGYSALDPRLVLEDENGKEIATFSRCMDASVFSVTAPDGRGSFWAWAGPGGDVGLEMSWHDEHGLIVEKPIRIHSGCHTASDSGGVTEPKVVIGSGVTEPKVVIGSKKNGSIVASTSASGPYLLLSDEDERGRVLLGPYSWRDKDETEHTRPVSNLTLMDSKGRIVWQAP